MANLPPNAGASDEKKTDADNHPAGIGAWGDLIAYREYREQVRVDSGKEQGPEPSTKTPPAP